MYKERNKQFLGMGVKSWRLTSIFLIALNLVLVVLGGILVAIAYPGCDHSKVLPIAMVSMFAAVKMGTMIKMGIAQEATAKTITDSSAEADVLDSVIRHDRRAKYKTWLWWSRFAMAITILQILGAFYLMCNVARYVSEDENNSSDKCFVGLAASSSAWKRRVMILFMTTAGCIAVVQCFAGSDVLKWRFFYATQDDAWKAHYQEVFDYGIREALCCLGRIEYLTVLEDDEVYSVAKLLGDLVAYRASGTRHLELLSGLALLQKHGQPCKSYEGFAEAPVEHLQVAAAFHKFAEAAYTGPLLDFGRNPFVFPCAWLYRQGVLTPWTRNRRPALDGDNWWRGHAAAFLNFVNLPPEVLRRGRVCQNKCEAAYFVVVLHHVRSVVIAIRGTETPEDLITDGLGQECSLSVMDLDGLIKSSNIHPSVKQRVESSFPHYGHSGIIEAARDLYAQIEGYPKEEGDTECQSGGFLSSLLGAGCECEGYNIRIVGHSLGGAIGAVLGIRLYGQFPNLHVYSYGPLPCVDSVVADACSDFVTSIVHHNEFSTRLSVGSILRLRAAAITALSEHTKTDTALIFRLAYQFNACRMKIETVDSTKSSSGTSPERKDKDRESSLCHETDRRKDVVDIEDSDFVNPFAAGLNRADDPISQFMEIVSQSENGSPTDPTGMFLPGILIHIVPQQQNLNVPLWKSWRVPEQTRKYKAFLVDREYLKDIVLSPNMFFDHLPWRCSNAMRKVLEAKNVTDTLDLSHIV